MLTSTYPAGLSPTSTSPQQRFRRRFVTILHVLSLLSSLIAISVFAAAIPSWNKNFFHDSGPNRGDWTDGMPLGPLTFALLYHITILIQGQVQKSRKPAVSNGKLSSLGQLSLILHTLVPCLVLLSLFPALLLAAYGSLFRFWQPSVPNQSGILVCNMLNIFSRECEPTLYHIGSLQIVGITFGALVWTLHFCLLLVSLRNVRRARLAKQLQQEKIAKYARSERSSSRSNRRGFGSPRASASSSHGAVDHGIWHQSPPTDRSRRSGPSSSSNSKSQSRPAGPTEARREPRQQEVPLVLIQAPEMSHPPISSRSR